MGRPPGLFDVSDRLDDSGTWPSSSMLSGFTACNSRWSLNNRRSSRASSSWVTRDAAVVKATVKPFWQAARPSARATWVLPVPLLPSAMTFSRRAT